MIKVSKPVASRRFNGLCVALLGGLALVGCTNTNVSDAIPSGAAAYGVIPAPQGEALPLYRIGALDMLSVRTFNEPELTFDDLPVDVNGGFSFPFIGRVDAEGMTASELEQNIKSRLDQRYTQDAQVVVLVKTAASQLFTVEGDVGKPGSFEYAGQTTLLDAIARAGSPTDTAKESQVVVFRFVGNERYGAVFDLNDIREGRADDPELRPGDRIFVGYSGSKTAWQQFLQTAPLLNAFTRF